MIGIEGLGLSVTPLLSDRKVGEDVKIVVKLYNDGNSSGTVWLKTYVKTIVEGRWRWILLDTDTSGTQLTVNAKSSKSKTYYFKPFWPSFYVKAVITGDSSDEYETDLFSFDYETPKTDWYSGNDQIMRVGNCINMDGEWEIPSECRKTSFNYGETLYFLYKQKNFANRDTAHILHTWLRKLSSDTYHLMYQGVLTWDSIEEGYYWLWYAAYWWHRTGPSYYPTGTYVGIITVDMYQDYSHGWNIFEETVTIS